MTYDRACTIIADTAANTAVDGKPMTKKKKDLIEALMFAYDVLHKQGKVISCKDCVYYNGDTDGYGVCTRFNDTAIADDVVKDTDYCSRAKEKDEVNNDN